MGQGMTKLALFLLCWFSTRQETTGFLSSSRGRARIHCRCRPESLTRLSESRQRPRRATPVPHFSLLANVTSSTSIEEWMQAPPENENEKNIKDAFLEWSSQDQARFIGELGYHGEYEAVLVFWQRYARRNTYVFNAALSTLVDIGCLEGFDSIVRDLETGAIRPSSFTLATIFRSAKDATEVARIREKYLPEKELWTTEVFESAIRACTAGEADVLAWKTALKVRDVWMKQDDVLPTTPIYVALFEALANMPHISSEEGQKILNDMLKTADEHPELFQIGDNRLWGTILQAFAARQDDTKALQVLRTMNERNVVPNGIHCTIFIKMLSFTRGDEVVVQFLNIMSGIPCSVQDFDGLTTAIPDQIVVLAVLSALSRNNNYELANEVLYNMKDRKYGEDAPPNEQAYNLVLATCDSPVRAKDLVREMRLTRRHRTGVIAPSLRTYSRAIAVCRKAGDLEMAMRLFELVKDDGLEPDVYIFSAVIWTAAEIGDFTHVKRMMDEMMRSGVKPNIISYNGLLAAYERGRRFDEMVECFLDLQEETAATASTFHILSRAARKVIDIPERCSFLEKIYQNMKVDDKHVSIGGRLVETYIFALGIERRYEDAKIVFESIQGASDAPILRSILFACSNAEPPAWEDALEILHTSDIFFQSRPPAYVDEVALAYAMLACSKADRWEEALNLLQLYESTDTSVVAFNSLIAACGRCSRPDVAVEVLNEMEHRGIDPDELSYRNAIIACNQAEHARSRVSNGAESSPLVEESDELLKFEWWEVALSLLRRMKESGLTPDIQTYSSAISACEAGGQWQRALGVLQKIDERDMNLYCFNAAISACEKGGAWVEAVDLYEKMKTIGDRLKPNFVTVNSVVEVRRSMRKKLVDANGANGIFFYTGT